MPPNFLNWITKNDRNLSYVKSWLVRVISEYYKQSPILTIYQNRYVRKAVDVVVSIGYISCFLSWFSSTGILSDYTSLFYLRHCFITKIERKIKDVYNSKDERHNLYFEWKSNGDYWCNKSTEQCDVTNQMNIMTIIYLPCTLFIKVSCDWGVAWSSGHRRSLSLQGSRVWIWALPFFVKGTPRSFNSEMNNI